MPSTLTTATTVQVAIKATPERVWNALVDGAITPAYYFGYQARFELRAGAPYRYTADDEDTITGTVLAVEPGRSLTTTFNGHWAPEVAELPESQVTFRLFDPLMPMPGVTFLSMSHEQLPESPAAAHLELGWVSILSGLKTLLETGTPLAPAPAAH